MISVQLYTVRDAVAIDLPGALARLAGIGFRDVELYGFVGRANEFAAALAAAGLTASSAHATLVDAGDDALSATIDQAAGLGVHTLVEPGVGRERWQRADDVRRTADALTRVAERAAAAGIAVGYHNHEWELQETIDGRAAFELFTEIVDSAVVLEVDTYWVAVAGHDPATVLARLGPRVGLIHLKDGPATRDVGAQVALGTGTLDIPAILAAAPRATRVVELDAFRGDVFDAVRDGYTYLATRGKA